VGTHFRTIPVIDGNGDQLFVYEIRRRLGLFGLRARGRLELCTGEVVEPFDGHSFVVINTGEKLTRVAGEPPPENPTLRL
jgi:hypothetical protein